MKHFNGILLTITVQWLWVSLAWAAQPLSVFVTIAPQRHFVQQIGKQLVDVQVLVQPGADPHTYEPKPRQMVALSKAKLYFAIGIGFEDVKLEKISAMNPRMRVIHTDHGIMKLTMAADHGHGQEQRRHGEHDHAAIDPHIWLSPPMVMTQARAILTALQAADPVHGDTYEANYQAFLLDLAKLDAHLRRSFDGLAGKSFMVFHPSWGTFAHTYGLQQVPIEVQGKTPKPAELKRLIEDARSKGIKVVFVQPQFSAKSARQIARAIGGKVLIADPLAEDWATNLRRTAEEFKHAFK